jgi:folate-binding protein YgfZ
LIGRYREPNVTGMTEVAARPVSLDSIRTGAVVYLDESRTRIAVTGEDRISWLDGVLSNHVASVSKGGALYACALTEKGKIIADAIVIVRGEQCGVWVPKAVAQELVSAWDRYITMEDVELAQDEGRRLLFLQGGAAEKIAHDSGLHARAERLDDIGLGSGLVLDVSRDEAEEVEKRLMSVGAVRIEQGDVRTYRVEAGRATFGFDFDQKTYVQEAGLEGRAVSFTKGCYHGQEVVCMLENRGKVSRRLVQLEVDGVAAPGEEITSDGTTMGKVTSVVPHVGGKTIALAMIKAAVAQEGASISVAGKSGKVLALAR